MRQGRTGSAPTPWQDLNSKPSEAPRIFLSSPQASLLTLSIPEPKLSLQEPLLAMRTGVIQPRGQPTPTSRRPIRLLTENRSLLESFPSIPPRFR